MAAYRRDYDSRHLQADWQEPGSAPEPYARQSSNGLPLPSRKMQNSRTGFEYLMGFADSVVYSGSAGAGFAALENSNKTTHRKFYKRALESHVQSGPIWANMTHKFRRQLAQWPL